MFMISLGAVVAGLGREALNDTIRFVREKARPWIDSGQDRASDDPYTIQAVGDLTIRQHAAEAMLDKAGLTLDAAVARPDAESVAAAQLAVAEAKVLTTDIALAASNKLFELSGTRSTLAAENLDRHWRNARTHTLHDPVRWKVAIVGNHALNGVAPPFHAWS
jgi:alkylation response protein AidB-like acyl-CoA dehydrogenase